MKTITVEQDGSLTIAESGAAGTASWHIQPQQIALHRRDPAFEAALQAAKDQPGNLTAAQLTLVPALPS